MNEADILDRAEAIFAELDALPLTRRVELLNRLRRLLHEHIPFRNEPTDCVEWLPAEGVEGNNYNPNAVAPPEMRLLEHSVRVDGFTQPIVAHREGDRHVVVDGFHRQRVGKDVLDIAQRLHGYLPVVTVRSHRADVSDRMAATIRHNRARGVHGVRPMTDIVTDLLTQGWSEADVARELGMDPDEVLRFKQISGLPGLFADHSYSQSWE